MGLLMDLEIIVTELQPLRFQWMALKLCRLIVDMLKLCIRMFDGGKNKF